MMRTFIAIDLDAPIRKRLAALQERLKHRSSGLKWVHPDHCHLTLKFLGEIRDQQIEPIGKSLAQLAEGYGRFEIGFEGLGVFPPSGGDVKVLWVGLRDPSGGLERCHALCEQHLAALGFEPEHRAFSPHLTLARNRHARNSRRLRLLVKDSERVALGEQEATGITFYQSTLTRDGPVYSVLCRHAFQG